MKNLIGEKFGRLTVIAFALKKEKRAYWLCKCDCGNEKIIAAAHLRSGHTKSCGCLHKEVAKQLLTKHGKYFSRIYHIYIGIKERCFNKNCKAYKNYGGRGITICDEWKNDFQAFYDWAINNGYDQTLSIDRINTNGNYDPTNCRWITLKEQQYNKRSNVLINYNGEVLNISQWAKKLNIKYSLLQRRLKVGYPFEKAISNINFKTKKSIK